MEPAERSWMPAAEMGADFLRNEHPHLLWQHRPPCLTTTCGDCTGESGAVGHGGRAVPAGSQCSQRVPGLRVSRGSSCLCEMGSPPPLWAARTGHRSRTLPGQTHAAKRWQGHQRQSMPQRSPETASSLFNE